MKITGGSPGGVLAIVPVVEQVPVLHTMEVDHTLSIHTDCRAQFAVGGDLEKVPGTEVGTGVYIYANDDARTRGTGEGIITVSCTCQPVLEIRVKLVPAGSLPPVTDDLQESLYDPATNSGGWDCDAMDWM